jgi:hypothetical protein
LIPSRAAERREKSWRNITEEGIKKREPWQRRRHQDEAPPGDWGQLHM